MSARKVVFSAVAGGAIALTTGLMGCEGGPEHAEAHHDPMYQQQTIEQQPQPQRPEEQQEPRQPGQGY